MPLSEAAAYRAAAGAYLTVEAHRWAAQLRLDVAIAERRDPAIICFRHECVWATVAALARAAQTLELCEAELRAAIPIPLVLPKDVL